MLVLQPVHLPRNTNQLSTGIFCHAFTGAWHLGQCESGFTKLYGWLKSFKAGCAGNSVCWQSCFQLRNIIMGRRKITTLRKLPTNKENTTKTAASAAVLLANKENTSFIRQRYPFRRSVGTWQ